MLLPKHPKREHTAKAFCAPQHGHVCRRGLFWSQTAILSPASTFVTIFHVIIRPVRRGWHMNQQNRTPGCHTLSHQVAARRQVVPRHADACGLRSAAYCTTPPSCGAAQPRCSASSTETSSCAAVGDSYHATLRFRLPAWLRSRCSHVAGGNSVWNDAPAWITWEGRRFRTMPTQIL